MKCSSFAGIVNKSKSLFGSILIYWYLIIEITLGLNMSTIKTLTSIINANVLKGNSFDLWYILLFYSFIKKTARTHVFKCMIVIQIAITYIFIVPHKLYKGDVPWYIEHYINVWSYNIFTRNSTSSSYPKVQQKLIQSIDNFY